tara:strand:+ start:404 stop:616 length:213 start_codon:yes stop_codon:yes gene_type:complete
MFIILLILSCGGDPTKHNTLHPPSPTTVMQEVTSDVDEAKNDLSCIKTYLQAKEDGSSIGFEEYENLFCK